MRTRGQDESNAAGTRGDERQRVRGAHGSERRDGTRGTFPHTVCATMLSITPPAVGGESAPEENCSDCGPSAASLIGGQSPASPMSVDVRHVRCRTMPTKSTHQEKMREGRRPGLAACLARVVSRSSTSAPSARRYIAGLVERAERAQSHMPSTEGGLRLTERRSHPTDLSTAAMTQPAEHPRLFLLVNGKDQP